MESEKKEKIVQMAVRIPDVLHKEIKAKSKLDGFSTISGWLVRTILAALGK